MPEADPTPRAGFRQGRCRLAVRPDGVGPVRDHDVVPGAAQEHVRARPADEDVVVVAPVERVVAVAAEQDVVARPPAERQLDRTGERAGGGDDVVAGEPARGQPVVRRR
jgi:hypothetical protein